MTHVVAPADSRRPHKKPSPVIAALAVAACLAAGTSGYFLLFGSSSSSDAAAPPIVHHAITHTARTAAPTAAQKAAASQALLTRALESARAEGSVETSGTYTHGGLTGHSNVWMGLTSAAGTMDIVGQGQVTVRFVGPAAYLIGDSGALQSIADVDPDAANLLGGKWLEIAKGDSGYEETMANSTLATQQSQDWFRGAVTQLPATTLDGRRVIPLRGAPSADEDPGGSATATLYVAADGDPLPLRYEVASATDHSVEVYGGWGTQQTVLAPPIAIDKAWLENAAAAQAAHPCGCAPRTSLT